MFIAALLLVVAIAILSYALREQNNEVREYLAELDDDIRSATNGRYPRNDRSGDRR